MLKKNNKQNSNNILNVEYIYKFNCIANFEVLSN